MRSWSSRIILLLAGAPLLAQGSLEEAVKKSKITLDLRTRYEWVEDSASRPEKTANALTNRTLLGFKTGEFEGATAFLQFSNVSALGEERYNSTLNGRTQYASVPDPGFSQVAQAYVEWKGLRVGRQTLSLDNQRFIGLGAWSQGVKSFTGAVFTNQTWIPRTELTLGHILRMHTATDLNKEMRLEITRAKVRLVEGISLTGFRYAVEDKQAPASSYAHQGLRLEGAWKGFLFEGSAAQQRGYKDSTVTKDRSYRQTTVGYRFSPAISAKIIRETLEGGFDTPLASLHGCYGWSDRIAKTPTNGLIDTYLQIEGKAWGLNGELDYHRFDAEARSLRYGAEFNALVSRPFGKHLIATLKVARYFADPGAPAELSLNKDLYKFWVMTQVKF